MLISNGKVKQILYDLQNFFSKKSLLVLATRLKRMDFKDITIVLLQK